MDPISFALLEVRNSIPPHILSLVFNPVGRQYAHHQGAVEAAIRDKVIEGRVRAYVDSKGPTEVEIPLSGLQPDFLDRFNQVWYIPKERTQGRRITSALAISYGQMGIGGVGMSSGMQNPFNTGGGCGYSPMMDTAAGIMHSHAPIPIVQSAFLSIIGENVVLVSDYMPLGRDLWLRCLLSSDSEFSFLRPQSYPVFAKMVVLATKAFIYNNFIIEMDRGVLSGGQELGAIRNIVEEYRDANELFLEMTSERLGRVISMNDPRRVQRHVKRITGGLG